MGIEENNKELIRRLHEYYNRRELDAADDIYAEGCFGEVLTWEQNKQLDIMILAAFPDMKWAIVDMIAEGDKVAFINNLSGTHSGEAFMGIPPTGKKIDCTNTRIVTIADDKIVEFNGTNDFMGLWQPLGVMPTFGEAMQAYKETHNLE